MDKYYTDKEIEKLGAKYNKIAKKETHQEYIIRKFNENIKSEERIFFQLITIGLTFILSVSPLIELSKFFFNGIKARIFYLLTQTIVVFFGLKLRKKYVEKLIEHNKDCNKKLEDCENKKKFCKTLIINGRLVK